MSDGYHTAHTEYLITIFLQPTRPDPCPTRPDPTPPDWTHGSGRVYSRVYQALSNTSGLYASMPVHAPGTPLEYLCNQNKQVYLFIHISAVCLHQTTMHVEIGYRSRPVLLPLLRRYSLSVVMTVIFAPFYHGIVSHTPLGHSDHSHLRICIYAVACVSTTSVHIQLFVCPALILLYSAKLYCKLV